MPLARILLAARVETPTPIPETGSRIRQLIAAALSSPDYVLDPDDDIRLVEERYYPSDPNVLDHMPCQVELEIQGLNTEARVANQDERAAMIAAGLREIFPGLKVGVWFSPQPASWAGEE